ncbi:MAG: MBOAT family protein [Spirochaetes bacterium]|nr:MBOAT family protein [Spirochaetota bacterium]MBU1082067.1 MBOAT family protein [Spirochaetota bacterium]
MVFSSPAFLYLFLPLFLGVYYLVPPRARTGWILAGSWLFYSLWRPDFLVLLVAVSFANWAAGAVVAAEAKTRLGRAKAALALVVVADLAVLGYFKYFNFGIDTVNAVLSVAGAAGFTAWRVVLPVGISFYVFQAMSYVVDVYRGDAPASGSFVDMAAYIALFPQLVAGPIIRYKDLAGQLRRPDRGPDGAAYGLRRFVVGLCRKVLIADTVAPIANAAFTIADPSAGDAWLGVIAYAVQLYFDFSGYSDMAVGLGRMMGFSFMENFDAPYRASSVTDFWRRWHISLSTWLRDYLYIPLGGNRKGVARTYLNLALVMVIGGLWHGASWNFVAWGCWHGAWLCVERLASSLSRKASPKGRSGASAPDRLPGPLALVALAARWATAQVAVLAGWVVFRATDMDSAGRTLRAMFRVSAEQSRLVSADMAWRFGRLELFALAAGLILAAVEPRAALREYRTASRPLSRTLRAARPAAASAGIALALAAAAIKLSADGYSPFLYFQF